VDSTKGTQDIGKKLGEDGIMINEILLVRE
jgi:hypothetical protein